MANEPAFPVQDCAAYQYPGMTLRDWFAGQAMASMLSGVVRDGSAYGRGDCNAVIVQRAYVIADAMLAEREKPDAQ